MPSHGLNTDSAYIAHGLNESGGGEQPVQQPPIEPPRRSIARPVRRTGQGGGGGGAFVTAAFLSVALASKEAQFHRELQQAADRAAELAQDPEMQHWVSQTLTAEATQGRDVTTDTAVAEIVLERLQAEGSAPIVKATHLAASFVALGMHVVLVGHGRKGVIDKPLAAVYVDGVWAYADPNAPLPLGGHEPFRKERYYRIPDLADPAPSQAELELEKLRAEMARMHEELRGMQKQIDVLLESALGEDNGLYGLVEAERARADRLEKLLVVGALTVSAVALVMWWQRAGSSTDDDPDATDE